MASNWDGVEERALCTLLKDLRVEEAEEEREPAYGQAFWQELEERMKATGHPRTARAIQNYWKKQGRDVFDFNEVEDHLPGISTEFAAFQVDGHDITVLSQKMSKLPSVNTARALTLAEFRTALPTYKNGPEHMRIKLDLNCLDPSREKVKGYCRQIVEASHSRFGMKDFAWIGDGSQPMIIIEAPRPGSDSDAEIDLMTNIVETALQHYRDEFGILPPSGLKVVFD